MKKGIKIAVLSMISLLSLASCGKADLNTITFNDSDLIQESFGGLGVEWGAYEDTDKLIEGGWEKVIAHMDHLEAARIRLMISYDWFCQNFDDNGNDDKTDDTWTYNFSNKYALNMIEILEYCQIHNIDVAFGAWNVIGSLGEDDRIFGWKQIANASAVYEQQLAKRFDSCATRLLLLLIAKLVDAIGDY